MFYKKRLTFILILYTLKKNKEVLMNKTLTFITTVIFFLFSFCGIFWLQYNKNLSNKILKETTAIVEKGVKEVSTLAEENPVILKKINSLPLQITYFRTKGRGVLQRHNFAGVTFKNMSPLLGLYLICLLYLCNVCKTLWNKHYLGQENVDHNNHHLAQPTDFYH